MTSRSSTTTVEVVTKPKTKLRSRGANMTMFEDEALCRAYVCVSVDFIHGGTNQTGDRLWELVSAKYHEQPNIVVPRTLSSLQSRYHTISSCVQHYVTKLAHAISTQSSEANEADWVNEARDAYAIEKNKPFQFEKCYQILKDLPKFSLSTTCSKTQLPCVVMNESGGSFVNPGDESSPIDTENPSPIQSMGRSEAKLQLKRKEKERSLSIQNTLLERFEKFVELYETNAAKNTEMLAHMAEQMERLVECREKEGEMNKHEEARREREEQRKDAAEEATFLAMDVSRMSDEQRELFNFRIQQLLQRKRQAHQASQNFSNFEI